MMLGLARHDAVDRQGELLQAVQELDDAVATYAAADPAIEDVAWHRLQAARARVRLLVAEARAATPEGSRYV